MTQSVASGSFSPSDLIDYFESAQSLLFEAGYELVFILAVFDGTSLARNVLVERDKTG